MELEGDVSTPALPTFAGEAKEPRQLQLERTNYTWPGIALPRSPTRMVACACSLSRRCRPFDWVFLCAIP